MPRDSLPALSESLIQSLVPGTSSDHLLLSQLRSWTVKELRNDAQGGTRREWEDARRSLEGLTHTARVRVQDDLAEALVRVTKGLEGNIRAGGREWDEGLPVTVSSIVCFPKGAC
jgi:gamma-tubulin complex component 5